MAEVDAERRDHSADGLASTSASPDDDDTATDAADDYDVSMSDYQMLSSRSAVMTDEPLSSVTSCAALHSSSLSTTTLAVQETTSPYPSEAAVYHRSTEPSHSSTTSRSTASLPQHTSPTAYQRSTENIPNLPASCQSLSSGCGSSLMDFTSVEIPRREYPPELREPQYDAVVISTRDDQHLAEVFKYILTQFITLEDGRRPAVCTMLPGSECSEFVYTQSTFKHMELALERSTYMMMIITEKFCTDSDGWAELQRDECLMESINNPQKRWCVIPVLMPSSSSDSKLKLPFGLMALKAVDVSKIVKGGRSLVGCCASDSDWRPAKCDIDALYLDNMTRMLNERLYMKLNREKTQQERLQRWIKKEQMKRYKQQQRKNREDEQFNRRLQEQMFIDEFAQGDVTSVDVPTSSSSSSSSQHQQQPVINVHVHMESAAQRSFVFNGPMYNSQFGDSNTMHCNHVPQSSDTEWSVLADESTSQDAATAHDESSLQSDTTIYEVYVNPSPDSLPTSAEPLSCDMDSTASLMISPVIQPLPNTDESRSQSHHQHYNCAATCTTTTGSATAADDHTVTDTEDNSSQHYSCNSFSDESPPGNDGFLTQPPLIPSTINSTAASHAPRVVAVVSPFSSRVHKHDDDDETQPKTTSQPRHYDDDDDDETGLKTVTPHRPVMTSRQHASNSRDDDTSLKQVFTTDVDSTPGISQRREDTAFNSSSRVVDGIEGVTSSTASDVTVTSVDDAEETTLNTCGQWSSADQQQRPSQEEQRDGSFVLQQPGESQQPLSMSAAAAAVTSERQMSSLLSDHKLRGGRVSRCVIL